MVCFFEGIKSVSVISIMLESVSVFCYNVCEERLKCRFVRIYLLFSVMLMLMLENKVVSIKGWCVCCIISVELKISILVLVIFVRMWINNIRINGGNYVIVRINNLFVRVEVNRNGCRCDGWWNVLKENSRLLVRYFV